MIDKVIKWFVISSSNPERVSASLKGLLLANIGLVMYAVQYFGLPYSVSEVTDIIGTASGLVGVAIMAFGMVRKLHAQLTPDKSGARR